MIGKMIICITGTPGTGKTYFAKKLAKITGYRHLELNSMIVKEKLYDDYDKKDKTFDVDTSKLSRFMDMILKKYRYNINDKFQLKAYNVLKKGTEKKINIMKFKLRIDKNNKNYLNNIIIDSHLSHYIDADFCFVVKSDIKKIAARLGKREYSKAKIKDNIQSEIFDICLEEARNEGQKIIIIEN